MRYGKPIKNKRRVNPRYHLHEGNALDYVYGKYGDHTNKGAGYEHTAGGLAHRDLQNLHDDVTAFFHRLPYGEDASASQIVQQYMEKNPNAHEGAVTDFVEVLMDQASSRDLKAKREAGLMNESKQPTTRTLMEGFSRFLNEEANLAGSVEADRVTLNQEEKDAIESLKNKQYTFANANTLEHPTLVFKDEKGQAHISRVGSGDPGDFGEGNKDKNERFILDQLKPNGYTSVGVIPSNLREGEQ